MFEADISIEYAYASATEDGPAVAVVLGVPDATKAAVVAGL